MHFSLLLSLSLRPPDRLSLHTKSESFTVAGGVQCMEGYGLPLSSGSYTSRLLHSVVAAFDVDTGLSG
jgi:hypothetical protein